MKPTLFFVLTVMMGLSLPPEGCINGFMNLISYRMDKFKHIINNINTPAARRAQRLLARSGLAG